MRAWAGASLIFAMACVDVFAQSPQVLKALPVEEPGVPAIPAKRLTVMVGGISFDGIAFDSRSHRVAVADQARGPASKWLDSSEAGSKTGGLAAVNAGFFTPEGAPLGLVVSRGKAIGNWNGASSLGSGLWFEDASGRMMLARREAIGAVAARKTRELIQAGPMLVDRRRAVGGLDDVKTSARMVLLWDGGHRWFMARTMPCTLHDLADALGIASPAGWPVHMALNLDGGRSAELWISDKIPGGPAFIRPLWNKPVRNFLVLYPRR
jgi:uncharacterized protein YigE (DUF2233 family)